MTDEEKKAWDSRFDEIVDATAAKDAELTRLREESENLRGANDLLADEVIRVENRYKAVLRRIAGELGEFADSDGDTMIDKIRFQREESERMREAIEWACNTDFAKENIWTWKEYAAELRRRLRPSRDQPRRAKIRRVEEEGMNWISVKKRRPEKCDVILAIGLIGRIRTLPGVVKYNGRGKYHSMDGALRQTTAKITHWMELPAPPATARDGET